MSKENLKPELVLGLGNLVREMQVLALKEELLPSQRLMLLNRCQEMQQQLVELEGTRPVMLDTRQSRVVSKIEKTVPLALNATSVALDRGSSRARRTAKVRQVVRAAQDLNFSLDTLLMAGPHGPGEPPDK